MPADTVVYSILLKKENAHDDPIYCSAWVKLIVTGESKEPAKEFIVTGGLDCLVKVWRLENNKLELVHTLGGHAMAVVSVAVSPDGHTIASASLDSSLIIWELTSGNKVYEVQTGVTDVWKVMFSPDGSQVASGGHTGKIVIYGVENGKLDRVLDTRGKFALSIAWSPNGKYISSGSVDGTVHIFDVAQGKLVHTIVAHSETVRSVSFSPKSLLLATASNDGNMKIFDVASAGFQSKLAHKCWVLGVCFSPDGTRVATAAADGIVRIALVNGLSVLYIFHEHTDMVCGIQFNADSNKLLSVSKDKCINIYECPIPPKNTAKKEK